MKQQIIHGIGWTTAGRVALESTNLIVGIVLARLLDPEAFGLIAMIMVFVTLARRFIDLGFAEAIVQRKEINEAQLSTIFWLNLGAGILITLLMILSAPLIAAFYDEPKLVEITYIIAFAITVGSLINLQTALLRRDMQFRRQTFINIAATLISSAVAIGMALAGYGVWSLVARFFLAAAANAVVLWFTTPWKPRFIFQMKSLDGMMRFSINLKGFQLASDLVKNIDNLLIGRFLDVVALGIYQMAYRYMMLLNNLIVPILSPVLIPALSRIQDEPERLSSIYIKISQVIAYVTVPLAIGLMVTADTFVLSLLGEKWAQVIPLLQLFGLATIVLPILEARAWLATVLGRTDILLRWQIVDGVLSTILFFLAVQYGVIWVTAAFVFRTYALFYPLIAVPCRLVNLPFRVFMRKLLPVMLISAAMGVIVWLATTWWLQGLPPIVALVIQAALGGLIYIGFSVIFRLEPFHDLLRLVREFRAGTASTTLDTIG